MPETDAEKIVRLEREAAARTAGGSGERHYATPEEIAAQVAQIIARNGNNPQQAITQLINDNRRTRDKLRVVKSELDAVTKKLPAADAVVLTGDDKKAYDAFKALNLKPEELKTRVDLAAKLEGDKQTGERNEALKKAAEALGYPNQQLFVELVNDKKIHVEMRDGIVEGKPVKLPYMRPSADEKAPLILAKDYVATNLAGYVPALNTKPAADSTTSGNNGAGGNGTGFPAQSGGSSTASPNGPADSRNNGNGNNGNGPAPVLPGAQRYLSPSEARKANSGTA